MDGERLTAAVSRALGTAVDRLHDVRREPLDYDAFLANRTVSRLRGTADTPRGPRQWSVIEKVTEGPAVASAYLYDNGLRELRAYESGLLDDLAPGLAAPAAWGLDEAEDGRLTVWLEDLDGAGRRLTKGDLLTAARHLGRMAGRWLGRVPVYGWLFTGWIDRHAQPQAVGPARERVARLGSRRFIEERIGRRIEEVEALVNDQPRLASRLRALPQTLCHHDAVGANVFPRRRGGITETVLIDWEMVGSGPIGADLVSLVFSSARRGDISAALATEVMPDALAAYADGLRDVNADFGAATLRSAVDAAIALRWALARDVIVALEDGTPVRRGSAPHELAPEALDELIALTGMLFGAAERTRG